MKTLIPYHFVNGRIVGWKCFECERTFELAAKESAAADESLLRIQNQFRAHECAARDRSSKPDAAVA